MTATSRRPLARRALATAVLTAATGTALLATSPGAALAADGPTSASVGDVEESIVYIGVEWEGFVQYPTRTGQLRWSDPISVSRSCTGWFASDEGHVVTAGHCVDPEAVEDEILGAFLAQQGSSLGPSDVDWRVEGRGEDDSPTRANVRAVQPSAVEGAVIEDPLTAQVVDWQSAEDGDLALLKVNNLPEPTPALTVAADGPSVGDGVTAIGYPGNVLSVSDAARLRASFKSGTVSSTQVTHEGVARTEVNADMSGGMSGGPTVDDDGAVLGVNSAGFDNQAFNFITDHAALVSFLDHHDVEASAAGGTDTLTAGTGLPVPASSSQPSGMPATTLLAGAGALALAAGGVVLHRRRPSAAGAAAAPVAGPAAGADATRFVGRPEGFVLSRTPGVRRPTCPHTGNAAGTRFCRDCGHRMG